MGAAVFDKVLKNICYTFLKAKKTNRDKTSQELQILSSVTLSSRVTMSRVEFIGGYKSTISKVLSSLNGGWF